MIYELAAFISKALELYSFLIWIRIMLSWINPMPRQGSLTYYFGTITDPYLTLFKSKYFRIGILDFSVLIAIGVLSLFRSILQIYASYHTFRLAWFLQLLITMLWDYCISIFLFLIIILLIIRTLGSLFHSTSLTMMGSMADPILYKVRQALFPNRIVRDSLICIITLVLAFLSYAAATQVKLMLLQLTRSIGF